MYKLMPLAHPDVDRARSLGLVELKREHPTGHVYAFVEPRTSDAALRALEHELATAWPKRTIVVSVRAPRSTAGAIVDADRRVA